MGVHVNDVMVLGIIYVDDLVLIAKKINVSASKESAKSYRYAYNMKYSTYSLNNIHMYLSFLTL